jgi:hypothetical protein
MTNPTQTQILLDIKEKLTEMNQKLDDIKTGLSTDRTWLWKILALTIIGAFALVGAKLVLP